MSRTVDPKQLNGLALAYMGDAVYEQAIREHLIYTGKTKPKRLHVSATAYVSAKAQAYLVESMLGQELLTEEETTYYKRGRNAKSYTKAKNADTKTYSQSTGFEALFGFLYLTGKSERVDELIAWCIREIEKQ
ncbi:MAG: Mini-ribonuclease 3 [Alkalibacterium sp.]|uniref:Mini-ribonuclease 3 n=1 Tax=Alkalibacterium gilvum TaxID=1130080 RepID=A0A1H6SUJ7_9LACT|nr:MULTISPECIES: Mini-ribonuclease 3 [Alkalibacterium]MDN6193852.1 Mini-ribonuclease 3 [Alkalibacterium sp.]MDN6293974.1 Mini-ribonuclease 3 [Alkalibacterium sp.]MDN6295613.1 Mini-ribonuclease 3 [Alkalibacterium sp.]MDN6327070.1 Mini-ribonuclease 3 [Alkalibacterium sp.]MDN6385275.1 Mini-ribonuclease 3 [Alkalibacterium sp.]